MTDVDGITKSITDGVATAAAGSYLALSLVIGAAIIVLAIFAFLIVTRWKLFEKAGRPGWASIVPIYSTIVLFDVIGYKWYYILFFLLGSVPIVGQAALILFTISYSIKLAKSFGQQIGFGIGLALIEPVFAAIIAFDKKIEYKGPAVNGDIDFNDLF